jgi:hypothetical protein
MIHDTCACATSYTTAIIANMTLSLPGSAARDVWVTMAEAGDKTVEWQGCSLPRQKSPIRHAGSPGRTSILMFDR